MQFLQRPVSWFAGIPVFVRRLKASAGGIEFIILCALANVILYHEPLLSFAIDNLDGFSVNGMLVISTLFVVVFVITVLILSLLALLTQSLLKPFCVLMFLANSVAFYFIATYQVVLDKTMMGNIVNTDYSEASAFLNPGLIFYFCLFGILPGWFLLRTRIRRTSRSRLMLASFITAFVGLGWAYTASGTWLWIDQNGKKLGGMVMPWSYVVNMARYQNSLLRSSREQVLLPPATVPENGKTVVILVIGEAARAQNFSLYGYPEPTNPLLAGNGVVALKNATSCSTYTTASLGCILSHTGTGSPFSREYEPLPSYLQRHGVDVIWRTGNWGEPPLKVQSYQRTGELKKDCTGPGCDFDEVLLTGLLDRIRSSKQQNVFVILHQHGSHGPDYYGQYPQRFEVFRPVCRSVELNQCTDEELMNAYNNTILYTDYFLDQAISLLRKLDNVPAMLMYLSDHGESLGEHGLYLHGTPYAIAPDVQKDIPFIVWMSDSFMARKGMTVARLGQQESHVQQNVFHSILGAFDVRSAVYDGRQDIFSRDFNAN